MFRNVKVINKGESNEYIAIVMSGKLLIKQDDKSIGYLETGDMIGYMSYLELPGYLFGIQLLIIKDKDSSL